LDCKVSYTEICIGLEYRSCYLPGVPASGTRVHMEEFIGWA